jgi:phosphoglucomutase
MVLNEVLQDAVAAGKLAPDARENILELAGLGGDELTAASIQELVEGGQWTELNDRFFRKLKFGTGGLRGRTIGKVVTSAERGAAGEGERPRHPCVGTNAMNTFNVSRATRGLVAYVKKWRESAGLSGRPKLVFAHDTRHFSPEFASLCAGIVSDLGADVYVFDGCRPTPEMSYAVRQLRADAGVMITASHNPAWDNGYKVNFNDGAGIVEPHASGIIREVMAVEGALHTPLAENERGRIHVLGVDMDSAYLAKVETLMLRPELLGEPAAKKLKIVFTALHGTGAVFVPGILAKLGFNHLTVPEQDVPSGAFPTVESPNPENAPALKMAFDLADREGADIVIGTDPDCDRMGVGVRAADGAMIPLTGNQTGALIAWYRIKTMRELGILTPENSGSAVILKTFVTSPMLDRLAVSNGLRVVNTLTGFKWISAKLANYEAALPAEIRERYRDLTPEESRAARLRHSTFMVLGTEESYGYMGDDFSRDKDGNGAVVMFAELAAYAASQGLTVAGVLDRVYSEIGYFLEVNKSLVFEGADGAALIESLIQTYVNQPPPEVDGARVIRVRNFAQDEIIDEEGERVSAEKMLFVELDDGRSFAVRPSGTEPKIKYYMFGNRLPAEGSSLGDAALAAAKSEVSDSLASMWSWIQSDAARRVPMG